MNRLRHGRTNSTNRTKKTAAIKPNDSISNTLIIIEVSRIIIKPTIPNCLSSNAIQSNTYATNSIADIRTRHITKKFCLCKIILFSQKLTKKSKQN